MKISVLGTGMVGRSLAAKLAQIGKSVSMGTRDVEATLAVRDNDYLGNPPFHEWHQAHLDIPLKTFNQSAQDADLIFLATSGSVSKQVLSSIDAQHLDGKVIVDVSNFLTMEENSEAPILGTSHSQSLAEELQQAFPTSHIVKTLNHVDHSVMVNPGLLKGNHNLFISGENEQAKESVKHILQAFNWSPEQIIDLGGIIWSRALESYLLLWVRIYQLKGTGKFNFELRTELD